MSKYFAVRLAIITFVTAGSALAAPPARDTGSRPCTHCVMSKATQTLTASARGALFGTGAQHCRHQAAATVRWGASQKPCPHCTHAA